MIPKATHELMNPIGKLERFLPLGLGKALTALVDLSRLQEKTQKLTGQTGGGIRVLT